MVLFQIALLDIVFSVDSVITAIGLAEDLAVMMIAIVIAVAVMMVSVIDRRLRRASPDHQDARARVPAADRHHTGGRRPRFHFPKGYVYVAMAFSAFVEMLNIRVHRHGPPGGGP